MTERRNVWDALGINIKTWVLTRDSLSAVGDEDTTNAIRVMKESPDLLQALWRQPPVVAPLCARQQEMHDYINRRSAEQMAAQSMDAQSTPVLPVRNLPPNPMPMSRAITEYLKGKQATGAHKARTAGDKAKILQLLAKHIVASDAKLGLDPCVHEIATHHLVSFLNDVGVKMSARGAGTEQNKVAAPKTVQKRLSDLSSFFDYARLQLQATSEDHSSALAARRKDLNTASSRQHRHYQPYTSSQLQTIFDPKAYLAFNRDADYFWGPLLALHLGARLGELVTLRLADIKQQELTGIWYLTVVDAKNGNSERTIPISQPLVRLGFGNYVRHLRRLGAQHLFPHRDMSTFTAQRDPSKNCSRHFGSYLSSIGMDDADLVFHSFRHVVVTALQDGNTPPSDSMQIVGHAAQDHALKTGQLTVTEARSPHYNGYSHSAKARLNVENPLKHLKSHLDRCIQVPLDYPRLRLAARIVTEHTVASAEGFKSGWPKLRHDHTVVQMKRLR